MIILGISAFYHDSAAALVQDGQIIAAAQEERFTRRKFDASFPSKAITYCLEAGHVPLNEIDWIVFYDDPRKKLERIIATATEFVPSGFSAFAEAIPAMLSKSFTGRASFSEAMADFAPHCDIRDKLIFAEHHMSHAASAFFPSPFASAAVLTVDGVGEWATASLALGNANRIDILEQIYFPHSLGLLYSAFTAYLGFKVNSGEYKVMGLAPYGVPKYAELIQRKLIEIHPDGSFRLNMEYFGFCLSPQMINSDFEKLFGAPARKGGQPLTQKYIDVAASIQCVLEKAMLQMARRARKKTRASRLCLAGGVALNCVANTRILQDGCFDEIWIQPAAGDAGGALGAALWAYHMIAKHERRIEPQDAMQGALLGPEFSQAEIEDRLLALGARFTLVENEALLLDLCCEDLVLQKAVGWFQGRMEFGPRALGARSILADPRSSDMRERLNAKVKYRESFRPFAPAVSAEDAPFWFCPPHDSPYMLFVADVAVQHRLPMEFAEDISGIECATVPRSTIPAVTHIDYSARLQTVARETNPRLHKLLKRFKERTGFPILVNTSFNVRGEPIVCAPEDAFRCFMGSEIETLIIGNCILRKEAQDVPIQYSHKDCFESD